MGQMMRLDHILGSSVPEFLGDDNDPGTTPTDPSIGPGAAPITNAAQLSAAIAGAGGTLYVWALPPAYPGEVQIALQSKAFKVQPDLSDPGSYRIMMATATGGAGQPPVTGRTMWDLIGSANLSGLGLDSNTIIMGVVAIGGIILLTKVLGK